MSDSATSGFDSDALHVLATRCRRLRVPLWRLAGNAAVLVSGTGCPTLDDWCACGGMNAILGGAIDRWRRGASAGRTPATDAADPSGTLVPVMDGEGTLIAAAAVLSTNLEHQPAFARHLVEMNATGEVYSMLRLALRPAGRLVEEAVAVIEWMRDDLLRAEQDRSTLNQFSERLVQSYEETNMMLRFARLVSSVGDPVQLMAIACDQLRQVHGFGWIALAFKAERTEVPELAGRSLILGTPPCDTTEFEAELQSILHGIRQDNWTTLLAPGVHALADMVASEVIVEPITHDRAAIGALLAGNKQGIEADLCSTEMRAVEASADFLGMFHENLARFEEQRTLFIGTLQALTASIDAKDPYTCGHSARVALLASQLALAVDLGAATAERYRIAGLVHDVGKIGVPEAVLRKVGKPTDEEYAQIKLHPTIGATILKDIPLLKDVLPGVLHHHERWDGRGYPAGLAGEDIPFIARVLALADSFDAMSSTRSYRAAMPRAAVLAEIERCAGTQFDPGLVPAFVALDFTTFDRMLEEAGAEHRTAA